MTKRHKDLIGAAVSLAAKIQGLAAPGQVLVGEAMNQSLHISWRKRLTEQSTDEHWGYAGRDGSPYRVFRFVG